MRSLEGVCAAEARPYAATVRAFLATTATEPVTDPAITQLAKRTLGYGTAHAKRIDNPLGRRQSYSGRACSRTRTMCKNTIPIPRDWLTEASVPKLRLIVAADIPVNAAVSQIWASRKMVVRLIPHPEARARRPRLNVH